MNKKLYTILGLVSFGSVLASKVSAICPLCTIAVGAGVGLSRWLGIDDTISGLWIGALIVSMIAWILIWLNKKNIKFAFRKIIIIAGFYALTILPLFYTNIMGHPLNKIWGIDKILIGIVFGTIVFLLAIWVQSFLKKGNNGKSYFPYQKVVLPLLFLIIISLIFYLLT